MSRDGQEERASAQRAKRFTSRKAWRKYVSGRAAEANGTAAVLRKGFNSVAVACPCRDGLEKESRRSRSTRGARGLRQQ